MRVYVDFDDVLSETAWSLSRLVGELFGRDVPYDQIRVFNLQVAFSLSDGEIAELMRRAHEDAFLAGMPAVPGAVEGVRALCRAGHALTVVTGRPDFSYKGSVAWLERFGLADLPLLHVDKYGRAASAPRVAGQPETLSAADLERLAFDVAIDDSPEALALLAGMPGCRVFAYDRPWNRSYPLAGNMERVTGWNGIVERIGMREERD